MVSAEVNRNAGNEPELHLLLGDTFEPLWKSLFHGFNEFFFSKKLPPLKLESKPIPVKDIWGFYDYKKNGALGSTAAHVLVLGLIIGAAVVTTRRPVPSIPALRNRTILIVSDYPLKPAKTQAGGGGGGGGGDPLPASVGRMPKSSMRQLAPPAAVIRNPSPKLAVVPTVIVPPDIKLVMNPNMPDLGDPKSIATIPSNGPGARSGIGDGSDGGVGPGHGHGVGPGDEAGTGGDVFRFGKGVTAPRVIYQTDPEFSEEARKAKFQGNCVLGLVVDANGRPTNIRVLSALGMGLDEKAIESVKNRKFDPGKKDGRDVAVEIAVEVDFHLY
jgi:TonB family protein